MKTKLLLLLMLISTLSYAQTRIASGSGDARGVTVVDDYVYTTSNANLLRANKNQVGTNNFETVATGFTSNGISYNGYNLWSLNQNIYVPGYGIRSAYVGGTIPTSSYEALNTSGTVSTVYIYNNELYFTSTNPNNNSLHELRKATGVNSSVFVASLPVSHQYIADVTNEGAIMYFTYTGTGSSNGAIYKIDLAAAAPMAQLVKSGLPKPWGIHFVNDYLYFISSASTGYIRKIHKSGTGVVSYIGQSINNPRGIDIDGEDIYIAVVGTLPGIYKYTDTNLAPCTVNIPDANFKSYLVGNTAINTNGDAEIQCSEASAFTGAINVGNLSISDLTGIEAFTNLTQLYCYNNNLTSLDVSQNTALINLECYTNQLSSLNVSQNTALTRLSISSNMFTSLDVSANTDLEYLDCEANQLSALDVSTNTALTQLYCSYNQLTSLDVLANTALGVLQCSNNQLSNINVSANTALQGLGCSYNQLISLDVSANTALQGLDCSNNQLSSLDIANGYNPNLVQFNALNNLDLTCIQIDAGFTPTSGWQKEPTASYSDDCAALLSIDDFHLNSISLHPNPTTSMLNIEMTKSIKQATVYSMLGKEVLKTQNKQLNVSSLKNGVFLIKIDDENGNVSIKRFIKQ
ncbi:Internalin-like protein [Winogradskyella psychrotolerans RS-3]|uniref:Internalin-like protein n=1 Tax=Winogradskyella psychrotolerans RS-3 TaxID=641526 RepID=S7VVC6_9FLAO|nr:T9SS type A sorting domain-containing protein [Winogradskyella psychrotolerans]EPR74190.1 Internalin-like protein [Winogradskyella psychrotolerans RS-3]